MVPESACEKIVNDKRMKKPFHLMTPAERTAARIAENRAISERVAQKEAEQPQKAAKTLKKPPVQAIGEHIRATPEERAKLGLGSVIRKVQS